MNFNPFYEEKYGNGIHSDIKKSVECVKSNSCQKLSEAVQNIKTSIDRIHTQDSWDDTAGDSFREGASKCSNILNNVLTSINSLFVKSEQVYINCLEQLDLLQALDTEYKNHLNNKPTDESSKDYIEWDTKKKSMESQYNEMGSNIDNYLGILDDINGCTMNEDGSVSITIDIKNLVIPDVVIPSFIFDYTPNTDLLIDYNGWICINTALLNGLTYTDILKACGIQDDNGCAEFSKKYIIEMLKESGQIQDKINYNGYSIDNLGNDLEKVQTVYKMMASELSKGRPVMLMTSVKQNNGTYQRHFVAVVAIKKSAAAEISKNPDYQFKASDFGIADPLYADLTTLGGDNKNRVRYPTKSEDTVVGSETSVNTSGYYLMTFNSDIDYTRINGVSNGYFGANGKVFYESGYFDKNGVKIPQ